MNLSEVWELLEEDTRARHGFGRLQRRIGPKGRRNFFLGLEIPSRNRMLIFRVAADSVVGQPDVPDSRGLTVRVVGTEKDGGQTEVELVLTDPEHRDIFDLLVQDLVDSAEQAEGEAEGLARFLARLSNWQHMLRRLGPRGLTLESQRGLWGELWVLREVVAPVTGFSDAVSTWRGPLGTDQDFQLGAICIEVKTSTAATLDQIRISSERQLESPSNVSLLLLVLSLDARARHGQSLVEMVRSMRSAASQSGCLHALDDRLENSGYLDEDADLYKNIGYTVRSFHPFTVGQGFPRLVSGDLRDGVSEVNYSVSAAFCDRFQIDMQRPDQLLEGKA